MIFTQYTNCVSKKQWPILYNHLRYKMGDYFLDIQYEQAGLGQSLVWYFSAFMTCKNCQFTFTLPVCKVVIREGIPRLELITLKYVTLSCKLFNFHVKCLFLSIFLSPGVERQKIQFFIGFRVWMIPTFKDATFNADGFYERII